MSQKFAKPVRGEEEHEEIRFPFGEMEKKPYKMYNLAATQQHIHFYISQSIGSPDQYVDMIYRIASAAPTDVIYIHLNTPGGQIDTGVQIINAIRNTPAKVVTILESTAYSLGTLIFLSGDELVVHDNCMMMFHNFNGGLIGKGNELVSELEATVKWFAALAQDIYIPFLTQEEFDQIVRGEDMWMQTEEIKVRLERMMKTLESRRKKEAADEAAVTRAQLVELIEEIDKKAPKVKPAKVSAPAKKAAPKRGRPRKAKDVDAAAE